MYDIILPLEKECLELCLFLWLLCSETNIPLLIRQATTLFLLFEYFISSFNFLRSFL